MLRNLLTTLKIFMIMGFATYFFLSGFIGGVVLKSWETVKKIDLTQLEYRQADTWKQHLEVYSSIYKVHRNDSSDFLLKKLNRLGYEKVSIVRSPGQYAIEKSEHSDEVTLGIYLRGFHYPRKRYPPKIILIKIVYGNITAIRNTDGTRLSSFELEPELLSEIYDKGGAAREIVPLSKMPETLLEAFIAVEDRRFHEHWGVDVVRVFGSVAHNIRSMGRGGLQGASTITQQLSRNIYLSSRQKYLRKVKEALLAARIETHYSKDEILERYLNFINLGRYGSRALLGVQEAAKSYFGKEVPELEVHESAMLAGLPKSPSRYSPVRHPFRAKRRRNLVLRLMRSANFITEQEYSYGVQQPLVVEKSGANRISGASHFLDYVHAQLLEKPHLEAKLYNQGLKVYTTIDSSMQQVAEKSVAEHLRQLDSHYDELPDYDENKIDPDGIDPIKNYLQAGLVAIEPQTGYVRAMVGGRDYYITRQKVNFFNRAVQSKRQPGSAFKPIVFAALFATDPPLASPATIIEDKAWYIYNKASKKRWAPSNYSGNYFGDVTVRTALEKSINVATARLMNETTLDRKTDIVEGITLTIQLARKLGIESRLNPFPALALGASDLTLLELTEAYGTFANGGLHSEPISILYVEDRNGDILMENQIEHKRALDENVAYLITNMMQGVIEHGTGRRAKRIGLKRPAAGKTGTTNKFTDAWFVGYIPTLSTGVWVGFDDPKQSTKLEGAKAALPIWTKFLMGAARGEIENFRVPPGVSFREIDKETGMLKVRGKCSPESIIREVFLVGHEPNILCNAHD